jgi:putative solute:sodium symporter small subunit
MESNLPSESLRYWRANLRLVAILLVLWATVSFGLSIIFVEPLNQTRMGGFPLGFWFAHQGSIVTFLLLVLIYAILADRMARRFGVD